MTTLLSEQKDITFKYKGSTVLIQYNTDIKGDCFVSLKITYPDGSDYNTVNVKIINDTIGLFNHLDRISKAFKLRDKSLPAFDWLITLANSDMFTIDHDLQTNEADPALTDPEEQMSEQNGNPPPFDKGDVDAVKCQEQFVESLQTEEFHQLFKLISEKGLDVNKFKDYLVELAADKKVADDLLSPSRNAFLTSRPVKADGSPTSLLPLKRDYENNSYTTRSGMKYTKKCTCPKCNGDGLSVIANRFKSIFKQEIQYSLTEDDVKAMIFAGGLKSLTHYFAREKWNIFINLAIPTPQEVMKSAETDWMLLDSVCIHAVTMSRMKAFNIPTVCETCEGSGIILSY